MFSASLSEDSLGRVCGEKVYNIYVQSGRCSRAKHGGAYFSAVYGFMKDPIVAPGPY